jgi:hypothetical protein
MTLKATEHTTLWNALVKTDFTRANLAGAKLNQADVNGANFRGVIGRPQIEGLTEARNVRRRFSMRNRVAPAVPLIVAAGKDRQSSTNNRS